MTTASETHHRWEPGTTYVVGHQRPDTDAIASALGYAWFLTAIGQDHVLAARAGQPAEQTTFALQRFEQAPPRRLGAVAPTFGHAVRPQAPLYPTAPLSDAMARLAQGERVVPLVDGDGRPNGVITPMAIARAYCATNGGANPLSQPCGEIVEAGTTFPAQE
ncbi:MAG TPA: hypothetical protein VK689_07310, partial [Armatimonadota bacterium]|nr:hypothetical protein [Armatimonadota bacterium]